MESPTILIANPSEPVLRVGLQWDVLRGEITLEGAFTCGPKVLGPGRYQVSAVGPDRLELYDVQGKFLQGGAELMLVPKDPHSVFALERMTIGRGFHWQRDERQRFEGQLRLRAQPTGTCLVLNEIPLEPYLVSVISSEMNPRSPLELLKAHAIISRSWIVAQLRQRRSNDGEMATTPQGTQQAREPHAPSLAATSIQAPSSRNVIEIVRWTDRESHRDFDVCADDHCQRYRGIASDAQAAARDAVRSTRGLVLAYEGDVADARFSKCCGGMTEAFSTAWQDRDIPYLRGGCFDGERFPPDFPLPLSEEAHAGMWIESQPPAYCSLADPALRETILPDSDRDTRDFFRWHTTIDQDELRQWIRTKLGCDIGAIRSLEALQRGVSGRIIRLKIEGEKATLIVGKELEIRRVLSPTHLYSSAFTVIAERRGSPTIPERFLLRGAGWGHGVGLCQIGAAVMAVRGKKYDEILSHYFPGCVVVRLYS